MMDYPHLITLLAVEKEGTFGSAAAALGMSKSAISQKIRLLEQRLGRVTFERNPTRPTPLGRRLCRHIENVQFLETKLFLTYGDLFKNNEFELTSIKIAINDDIQSRCLLDTLDPITKSQSQFLFDVVISREQDALEALRHGNVRAAISSINFPIPDVTTHYLGSQAYVATASPSFLKDFFSSGVTEENLISAPSISYSQNPSLGTRVLKERFGNAIPLPSHLLPSSHGVLNSCLDGFAWGMNPLHLAQEHLASGKLVNLWPDKNIEVPLYWHVTSIVEELLDGVTQTVRQAAVDLQLTPPIE